MEASSPIGQGGQSSQNQALSAVSARVVTRAFGLRLGSFGVDYSSKQVTVEPDETAARKQTDTRAQAFQTELARESLREQISSTSSSDTTPGQENTVSHPDLAWRTGLTAYAKARNQVLTDAARAASSTLAVA